MLQRPSKYRRREQFSSVAGLFSKQHFTFPSRALTLIGTLDGRWASVPEVVVASVIRKVRDRADHHDRNRCAKKKYWQQYPNQKSSLGLPAGQHV